MNFLVVFLIVTFCGTTFAGTLDISGTLDSEITVSSVEVFYAADLEYFCTGKSKTGSVSQQGNRFRARVSFDSYRRIGCSYTPVRIDVKFLHDRMLLGKKVRDPYTMSFDLRGSGPLAMENPRMDCSGDRESPTFGYCTLPETPTPWMSLHRESANTMTSVRLSVTPPPPPVMEEVATVYDIEAWEQRFTLYKKADGKVGRGSVLKIEGKGKHIPSGLHVITIWEEDGGHGPSYFGSTFLNSSGEQRTFTFAPTGEENSSYPRCRYGARHSLTIRKGPKSQDPGTVHCVY